MTRLSAASPSAAARDMYAGEHWQVVRTLTDTVAPGARLWVASAGYGLISANAPIHAYAATFATGQADSVATSSEEAQKWWKELSRHPGPQTGVPRSLSALAERYSDSTIIAILSEAYLRACGLDLAEAASRLTDVENLLIFGPPVQGAGVDGLVVPVTAALRPTVGGSLQALNVRAAKHLLEIARDSGTPLRRSLLSKLTAEAITDAPQEPRRRSAGARLNNEEVCDYIRAQLESGPSSATRLLRKLRNSGYSCEQARFKELFVKVSAEGAF